MNNLLRYPLIVFRLGRGMCLKMLGASTVGVQAMVINEKEEILLVQHTYKKGWYFPGGGINKNEAAQAALCRELIEEVGIIVQGVPDLFGLYHHTIFGVDDYPALYIVKQFTQVKSHSIEIAKFQWHSIHNLPTGVSQPVIDRIKEYFTHQPKSPQW